MTSPRISRLVLAASLAATVALTGCGGSDGAGTALDPSELEPVEDNGFVAAENADEAFTNLDIEPALVDGYTSNLCMDALGLGWWEAVGWGEVGQDWETTLTGYLEGAPTEIEGYEQIGAAQQSDAFLLECWVDPVATYLPGTIAVSVWNPAVADDPAVGLADAVTLHDNPDAGYAIRNVVNASNAAIAVESLPESIIDNIGGWSGN